MKIVAAVLALVAASTAAPTKITYRVVNDCAHGTATRVLVTDPNGKVHENGIACTVGPIVVADTVKADTTRKK